MVDSLKVKIGEEDASDDESVTEDDNLKEWDSHWNKDLQLGTGGLQMRMLNFVIMHGDDPHDENWIPAKLRAKRAWQETTKKGVCICL